MVIDHGDAIHTASRFKPDNYGSSEHGALVEPGGRNWWQKNVPRTLPKPHRRAHGKEGGNGSSPLEGFRNFLLISSFRCRQGRRERASASTERPRAGESFSDAASNCRC